MPWQNEWARTTASSPAVYSYAYLTLRSNHWTLAERLVGVVESVCGHDSVETEISLPLLHYGEHSCLSWADAPTIPELWSAGPIC